MTRENYWFDERTAINYPLTFNMNFPNLGLEIKNVAAFPQQVVHGYWEGYCNIDAFYNKQKVKGFSYTELVYQDPIG